jgi:hypothetical protein
MKWSRASCWYLTWAIAACSSRVPIGDLPDDAGPTTTSGSGGATSGGSGGTGGSSTTGGAAGDTGGSTVGTGGGGGTAGSDDAGGDGGTAGTGGAGGSAAGMAGSGGAGGGTAGMAGTGGAGGGTAGMGGSGGATADAGGASNCPCTRRPGSGNSWQCPVGVGESTSMTIGPAGGKISLIAQQGKGSGVPFSLDIPPTALAQDTVVTITETSLAPPADFIDSSPVYSVEPHSLASSVRIRIVVPYGNLSGLPYGPLSVYTAPQWGDPFQPVADSYLNAGFMQASVTQFGFFFAGYPKTSAHATCP